MSKHIPTIKEYYQEHGKVKTIEFILTTYNVSKSYAEFLVAVTSGDEVKLSKIKNPEQAL